MLDKFKSVEPKKTLVGPKQMPTLIVLTSSFTTAQAGSAYAHAMTMHTQSARESVHFVVDESETISVVPTYREASPRALEDVRKMIIVRICDNPSDSPDRWDYRTHSLLLHRTADLVAQVCITHGIKPRYLGEPEFKRWSKWRTRIRSGIVIRGLMAQGYFPEDYFLRLVEANIAKHKLMRD